MSFTNEKRERLYTELLEEGLLLEQIAFSVREIREETTLPAAEIEKMLNEFKQASKGTFKTLMEYIKEKGKTEDEDEY